jgi:hypothetical protein
MFETAAIRFAAHSDRGSSHRCWNVNFDNSTGYITTMNGYSTCLAIVIIVLDEREEDIVRAVADPGTSLCTGTEARAAQQIRSDILITLYGILANSIDTS